MTQTELELIETATCLVGAVEEGAKAAKAGAKAGHFHGLLAVPFVEELREGGLEDSEIEQCLGDFIEHNRKALKHARRAKKAAKVLHEKMEAFRVANDLPASESGGPK